MEVTAEECECPAALLLCHPVALSSGPQQPAGRALSSAQPCQCTALLLPWCGAVAGAGRSLWVGNMRALPTKQAVERVFAKFGKMERMSRELRCCMPGVRLWVCSARQVVRLGLGQGAC